MKVILLHEHYDDGHLAQVIEEMRVLGAPRILAVWVECYGAWVALEGCHRLRAAQALGLTPEMACVEYDDETTPKDLGLDWQDPGARIAAVVDKQWRSPTILEFGDD